LAIFYSAAIAYLGGLNWWLKKKTVGDVVASRRTACQNNIVGAPVFQKILNRTV